MADVARILIYGDPHLSSKNYGAHVDYASESLNCYKKITSMAKEKQATHLIGLGDFTYGRFHSLEYREAVEKELIEQYEIVNGNHYELKGNHDSAGYGMTEYEYYIKKGLIKQSVNMTLSNVHITMVDSGKADVVTPNLGLEGESINVIMGHDFYRFSDSQLPELGKFTQLDDFTKWYGMDYLICGHIHAQYNFEGMSLKTENGQTNGHRVMVHYPGCLTRPSYRKGHMDMVGQLVLLTIMDTGEMRYDILDVELPSLEESFNLDAKEAEKETKEAKEKRVDLSDIISQLNTHERNIGNPEDIIQAMKNVNDKYKDKAVDLLKQGQA